MTTQTDINALAKCFSKEIHLQLTAPTVAEIIGLNRAETSESVCHSHDFCDANMIMLDAWVDTLGCDFEPCSESDCETWNLAWEMAMTSGFSLHL